MRSFLWIDMTLGFIDGFRRRDGRSKFRPWSVFHFNSAHTHYVQSLMAKREGKLSKWSKLISVGIRRAQLGDFHYDLFWLLISRRLKMITQRGRPLSPSHPMYFSHRLPWASCDSMTHLVVLSYSVWYCGLFPKELSKLIRIHTFRVNRKVLN